MDLAVLQQLFELYNEDVKEFSLGTNPALAIAVLRACKEGESSQQEVAARLNMKQPAAAKWVKKFRKAKLAKYGERQKNGSRILRLTPAGCELVAKLESGTDQFLPPVPAGIFREAVQRAV
jgi:DNA-binding MarR family transcriptional regulator